MTSQLPTSDELCALVDQMQAAIDAEETGALELLRAVEEFEGSVTADQLRWMARDRRVHGLQLQGQLAALIATVMGTR